MYFLQLLGHASVLICGGSTTLLCDPWLADTHLDGLVRRFPDPGPLEWDLPVPDAVFISHHHWDHVHIQTLNLIDRSTRILIPDNPQLSRILTIMGFYRIEVLSAYVPVTVNELKVWPVPSLVPFGECGIYVEWQDRGVLNLVDTVFDLGVVQKLNQISAGRLRLTLAPYQSYDEMGLTLRKRLNPANHKVCVQNAHLLSKLESEWIVPAADGLYFPKQEELNRQGFLFSPFDFIDELIAAGCRAKTMVPVVLDQYILHEEKVQLRRPLAISVSDLIELYEDHRTFDPDTQLPDIFQSLPKVTNDALEIIRSYFLQGLERFPQEYLSEFQRINARFCLLVEPMAVAFVFDFQNLTVSEVSPEVEEHNCLLRIGWQDLISLLDSKTLVTILMQAARIHCSGATYEQAYRALDMLTANGLLDQDRLEHYIDRNLSAATAAIKHSTNANAQK